MVYQDPGRALNPSLKIGSQMAEDLRARRRVARRGPGPRAWRCSSGCGSPTRCGHGALSAPALGRHAAAGVHRGMALARQSGAADPRRADHRARRHGRGRGAGPRQPSCAASSRPRSCSSATISRWSPGCATASACSMPGRWSRKGPTRKVFHAPRHPYTVGLLRCLPRRGPAQGRAAARHHSGLPAAARRGDPRLRLRRRAARWPTSSAAAPGRRSPSSAGNGQPLPLSRPRRRACREPRRPTRMTSRRDRPHSGPGAGRTGSGQDLRRPRAGAQGCRAGAVAGRDPGPGRRIGQRQVDLRQGAPGPDGSRSRQPIWLDGRTLAPRLAHRPAEAVKALQIVFQNPNSALNRSHSVRRIDRPSPHQAGWACAAARAAARTSSSRPRSASRRAISTRSRASSPAA